MRIPIQTPTLIAVLLAALALVAAGCGSSDADSDPQELLEKTFGEGEEVSSGVLDISLDAAAEGDRGGSLSAALSGPFETRADDELPLIDMQASLRVEGRGENTNFEGGLTITEDAAYVTSDGQAYEVDAPTFATFSELFAQSATAQPDDQGSAVFEQLGVDPAGWLTDVTNEGTEEIDGVETVHISGDADVGQIVADAQAIDPTGRALGGGDSAQLADAVRAATVDVYTGAEDNILRRLDLALELEDPTAGGEVVSLELSIGIGEVNEEQTIEAPANPKPLEDLVPGGIGAIGGGLPDIGDLGSGGGQAGGSGAQGGGGQGAAPGGVGGFTPEYQECISQAQTPEDFAACNDLLE